MIRTLDVRRHFDGSIDFDFYRRRAARRRRLALRLAFKKRLAAVVRVAKVVMSAVNRVNKVHLLNWQVDRGHEP